ncbi:transposase, partial [Tepidibacillus infernus]
MFLRQVKNKKTGRIYLSIVQSYRDANSKSPKSRTIESLGYLDELEKQYDDPIAFFNEKIKQMNEQYASERSSISFTIQR